MMRSRRYQRGIFDGGLLTGLLIAGAAGASSEGARAANSANQALTRETRDWQEAMRRTNYQAAKYDLEQAGFNPMLAVMKGGADTPGTTGFPPMENIAGVGVSSAMQGVGVMQGVQQIEQSRAMADQAAAAAAKLRSETLDNSLNTALRVAEVDKTKAATQNLQTATDNIQQQILGSIADSATKHAVFQEMNKGGFAADVARRKAESLMAQYGLAEAKAGSQFYGDVESMPRWIRMLVEVLRGGSSAQSMIRR